MRPVWAEISKGRLVGNFEVLQAAVRRQAGERAAVLAVVKANAYGHGAVECAPLLAAAGAEWLGVTSVDEGLAVRAALAASGLALQPKVLVMCGLWHGEAAAALEHALTPVVWEAFHLDLLEAEALRRGLGSQSVGVHLEIDTGMARQGVAPDERLQQLLGRLGPRSPLRLEGVLTHFASPEQVDAPQNACQMAKFTEALRMVREAGLRPEWVHAGNSSSVDAGVSVGELGRLAASVGARAMARPGLALYGCSLPLVSIAGTPEAGQVHAALQPVLAWKTRIVSCRDLAAGETVGYNATFTARLPMRLALLPVGYADGLRRELSGGDGPADRAAGAAGVDRAKDGNALLVRAGNAVLARAGGTVLVRGMRAPIVGRVSMDLTIVDVSGIEGAAIGDEVVILGEQASERVTAEDHARLAGTIPYEILCGISDRVPRVVVA